MILNSDSVELIRANATRLASVIRSKDDLFELATASSFDHVFSAIESLLTNTSMYFDDELLSQLNPQGWQSFKAVLLVYTFNIINRNMMHPTHDSVFSTSTHVRNFGIPLVEQ
jgi:hypothetical protein